jgi:hypothetical protein
VNSILLAKQTKKIKPKLLVMAKMSSSELPHWRWGNVVQATADKKKCERGQQTWTDEVQFQEQLLSAATPNLVLLCSDLFDTIDL